MFTFALRSSRPSNAARQIPLRRKIALALTIRRSRRALAQASPEQLADLGLTAEQAETEAQRPFWDAPEHWWR